MICSRSISVFVCKSSVYFSATPQFSVSAPSLRLLWQRYCFTVFHHIHHFAWVKSQAIPSKILKCNWFIWFLDVLLVFSRLLCQVKLVWGVFPEATSFRAKPSQLRSFSSEKQRLNRFIQRRHRWFKHLIVRCIES